MKIIEIPIGDIDPYFKNAKEHPEEQIKKIAKSIAEFGFNQPIVVDKKNVIVVGHGRYLAAQYYGSAQNRERVLFLGSKESFDGIRPEIVDDSKRFKDVIDLNEADYKEIKETDRNMQKIEQLLQFNFELIGKWDRVGTLTTQVGCGEKAVQWGNKWRILTPLECERLQGFKEGWTEGASSSARYFALGNAVNCGVSRYLFGTYLPKIWDLK